MILQHWLLLYAVLASSYTISWNITQAQHPCYPSFSKLIAVIVEIRALETECWIVFLPEMSTVLIKSGFALYSVACRQSLWAGVFMFLYIHSVRLILACGSFHRSVDNLSSIILPALQAKTYLHHHRQNTMLFIEMTVFPRRVYNIDFIYWEFWAIRHTYSEVCNSKSRENTLIMH